MIMVRCPKDDCQELMPQGSKDCGKHATPGKICCDCGKPISGRRKRCDDCQAIEKLETSRRSRDKAKEERAKMKAATKARPAELSTDHLNQAMLAQRMMRGAIQ